MKNHFQVGLVAEASLFSLFFGQRDVVGVEANGCCRSVAAPDKGAATKGAILGCFDELIQN